MQQIEASKAHDYRPLRRDRSIFSHIALFSTSIIVPAVLLLAGVTWLYADAERNIIEARRDDVTANAVHIVDREIARRTAALEILALTLGNEQPDLAEFHRLASRVGEQLKAPIILMNRAGLQLVSTRVPFGVTPDRKDLSQFEPVFETRKPVVTDVITGTVTGRPVSIVAVPVIRNGVVEYSLSSGISPEAMAGVLSEAGLPAEWIAAIVDRAGIFIARSRNADQFVGKLARPELVAAAKGAATQGNFSNVTLDGIAVENSFGKSALAGWTVVIAVPKEILHAPLQRALLTVLLVSVLSLGLIFAAVRFTGKRIMNPVVALQSAAASLARGEAFTWTHNPVREFNPVGEMLQKARTFMDQRDAAQKELTRTSSLLETVIGATPALVYAKDLQGKFIMCNPAVLAFIGKPWADVEATRETDWLENPGEVENVIANDQRVIRSGAAMEFEEVFTINNNTRTFISAKSPLLDDTDSVIGVVGISTDITEREQRANHVEFIMRELSHRSKNLLAVVQSIARQTVRSSQDMQDFGPSFLGRLAALAHLHDALVKEDWRGADLGSIAKAQVGPFANNRITLNGPEILLKPDVAQTLSMVLHELSTNASKHGAWSSVQGHVSVGWRVVSENGEDMFTLQWTEAGGPPVTPPSKKGFGSVVIERMSRQIPGAEVIFELPPEGVRWILTARLSHLVEKPALHTRALN